MEEGRVKKSVHILYTFLQVNEFSIGPDDSLTLRYDVDRNGFIDLMELKLMMEKLGEPQTHLGLKGMIKEVDEDNDGQISFREVRTSVVITYIAHTA